MACPGVIIPFIPLKRALLDDVGGECLWGNTEVGKVVILLETDVI